MKGKLPRVKNVDIDVYDSKRRNKINQNTLGVEIIRIMSVAKEHKQRIFFEYEVLLK